MFEIYDIICKIFRLCVKEFDLIEFVENLILGFFCVKYEIENELDDEMRDVKLFEDYFVIIIEDMFVGGYEIISIILKWVIVFLVRYLEY